MPTIWQNPKEQENNTESQLLERLFGGTFSASFTNTENTSKIAELICSATALGGSDGSLVEGQMTFEWALETKEGYRCRLSGPGMVDRDTLTNNLQALSCKTTRYMTVSYQLTRSERLTRL